MKYMIQDDTGVDYADSGKWRSYDFSTQGNSLQEMIENAQISEVDQDGGEIATYSLDDATNEVQRAAYMMMEREIECRALKVKAS